MPASALLGFWAVAALLIVVPGPDWAFAIGAGLRGHVVPAAAGIVLGYLAMTAAVAAGIGALVVTTPAALTVLSVLGGGYLIWLGVGGLLRPASLPGAAEPTVRGPLSVIARGVGVSGLNPKGLLIFLATLPQFTDPASSWPIPGQLAALGLLFSLTCAVVYLLVGASARRIRAARPGAVVLISRISATCMLLLGIGLLAAL